MITSPQPYFIPPFCPAAMCFLVVHNSSAEMELSFQHYGGSSVSSVQ